MALPIQHGLFELQSVPGCRLLFPLVGLQGDHLQLAPAVKLHTANMISLLNKCEIFKGLLSELFISKESTAPVGFIVLFAAFVYNVVGCLLKVPAPCCVLRQMYVLPH